MKKKRMMGNMADIAAKTALMEAEDGREGKEDGADSREGIRGIDCVDGGRVDMYEYIRHSNKLLYTCMYDSAIRRLMKNGREGEGASLGLGATY